MNPNPTGFGSTSLLITLSHLDMGEEGVPQTLTLTGSLYQTSDIRHVQESRHLVIDLYDINLSYVIK